MSSPSSSPSPNELFVGCTATLAPLPMTLGNARPHYSCTCHNAFYESQIHFAAKLRRGAPLPGQRCPARRAPLLPSLPATPPASPKPKRSSRLAAAGPEPCCCQHEPSFPCATCNPRRALNPQAARPLPPLNPTFVAAVTYLQCLAQQRGMGGSRLLLLLLCHVRALWRLLLQHSTGAVLTSLPGMQLQVHVVAAAPRCLAPALPRLTTKKASCSMGRTTRSGRSEAMRSSTSSTSTLGCRAGAGSRGRWGQAGPNGVRLRLQHCQLHASSRCPTLGLTHPRREGIWAGHQQHLAQRGMLAESLHHRISGGQRRQVLRIMHVHALAADGQLAQVRCL